MAIKTLWLLTKSLIIKVRKTLKPALTDALVTVNVIHLVENVLAITSGKEKIVVKRKYLNAQMIVQEKVNVILITVFVNVNQALKVNLVFHAKINGLIVKNWA